MPATDPIPTIPDRIRVGIAGHSLEAASLAVIVAVGAFLRLHYVPLEAGWDSDQGAEMIAMWNAVHSGALPLLGPAASTGAFHHGALYYYLMLPAVWLGGGDPTWVTVEIALLGVSVVPLVWWVARSIGGPAAGIAAAALAATAGGPILLSEFIWNPTLIEPGAALALFGAWQAWSSRRPAWLLVAGAGTAVVMQAHVTAGVIVLPMIDVLIALLWRGPREHRRRIAMWGAAAVALILATFLPFAVYELGHDFAETRAVLAYLAGSGQVQTHGPAYRIAFSAVRVLAWPIIGWPIWVDQTQVPRAVFVAGALSAGLGWRLLATAQPFVWPRRRPAGGPTDVPAVTGAGRTRERDGTWLVAFSLVLIIAALGLGVRDVSAITPDLTEQYHTVADPFVIVAAGVVLGSLWRIARPDGVARWIGRGASALILVAILNSNVGEWTDLLCRSTWPSAQAAASRIESVSAGRPIALVGLPNGRSTDAFAYPLLRDGVVLDATDQRSVVVVLCDSGLSSGCGGPSEDALVAAEPWGKGYLLVDRFKAEPNGILSIYVRP